MCVSFISFDLVLISDVLKYIYCLKINNTRLTFLENLGKDKLVLKYMQYLYIPVLLYTPPAVYGEIKTHAQGFFFYQNGRPAYLFLKRSGLFPPKKERTFPQQKQILKKEKTSAVPVRKKERNK